MITSQKLKFTAAELHAFNEVWSVELPQLHSAADKMAVMICKELAVKFKKKGIDPAREVKITLKDYEVYALYFYLQNASFLWAELEGVGVFEDAVLTKHYYALDQLVGESRPILLEAKTRKLKE